MSEPDETDQAERRAEFERLVAHARERWAAGESVVIVPYAEWLRRGCLRGDTDLNGVTVQEG